jgi:hypothetical protein
VDHSNIADVPNLATDHSNDDATLQLTQVWLSHTTLCCPPWLLNARTAIGAMWCFQDTGRIVCRATMVLVLRQRVLCNMVVLWLAFISSDNSDNQSRLNVLASEYYECAHRRVFHKSWRTWHTYCQSCGARHSACGSS